MASLPRRNVPPPMSTTASGSNNAVMPVTSPAFSLATNNRSKSWGSLAGSLVVKSFIVTLRQLLWVARLSLKFIVVTRRAANSSSWPDTHRCSQTDPDRSAAKRAEWRDLLLPPRPPPDQSNNPNYQSACTWDICSLGVASEMLRLSSISREPGSHG